MSDLFHEDIPDDYVTAVAAVMELASWHTFQVLTKRSARLRALLNGRLSSAARQRHIWWGVSVEDQKYGVPRIADLKAAHAQVRFLSVEPLLENLGDLDLDGIHWVIVGGESGVGSRPMAKEWVTSIRAQCRRAKVPFFFKQWGGVHKSKTGRELDGRTYDALPDSDTSAVPSRSVRMELIARAEQLAARWSEVGVPVCVPSHSLPAVRTG